MSLLGKDPLDNPRLYASMLTAVDEARQIVAAARRSAGLTVRALAQDADVASSTFVRIHAGDVDPGMETLQRILGAAGCELRVQRRCTNPPLTLGSLTSAWSETRGQVRPDWTTWRALLDALARTPDRTPEAIYVPPPPAGNPVIDALLAGVAEKLADDAHLRRPTWTADVPPLDEPYRPPIRGQHEIPPQLAARNLMIDVGSLWREPATVGL